MKRLPQSTLKKLPNNNCLIRTQDRRSTIRLLALSIALAGTLQAHSVLALFVDSSGGIDAGDCLSFAAPCQTIAYAISTTGPGEIIDLMSPLGAPNVFNESGLTVPFNLTIRSTGPNQAIIDAGSIDRIFTVNGGNLKLERVTVQNGNANAMAGGTGGAIHVINGSLTIRNSILQSNVAQQGGAISADNTAGAVKVLASTLRYNRSTASGGAIHCDGCDRVLVWRSHAYKNVAGVQGGAVYIQSSSLRGRLSRFTSNEADDGGAIFSNGSQVTINDSELRDNAADQGDGGGVYSAGDLSIQRSTLEGNTARENGGGVFLFGDVSLATSNSTYSGNSALAGGAISVVGNSPNPNPTVHVSNSTFVDNESTFANQGHHVSGAWSDFRLDNTILSLSPALQLSNDACTGPVTTGRANLISDVSCNSGDFAFNFGAVSGLDTTLAFNGGVGRTHEIVAASNAVDLGFAGFCVNSQTGNFLTVDQRRMARPADGNLDMVSICDVGAFELQ